MNEKLVQELSDLGLSNYEAKVFLILVSKGPLTAFEISEASKIPYSKVYETINKLRFKNMVEVSFDAKRKKFNAVSPANAIQGLIRKKEEEIAELKNKAREVSDLIEKQRFPGNLEGRVWISQGNREFLERVSLMIDKAKNYAYGITRKFSRIAELDEEIIRAAKRGVKIKLLGTAKFDEISLARAQWYVANKIEIKTINLEVQPRVCLIDGKEICMRIDREENSEFIWSDNQSLVNLVKTYFELLWERAEDFKVKQKIL
ncbi:MAG: TrmB family transcriptional regulator [Candidatus Aenigmatarchaeota archaeon]